MKAMHVVEAALFSAGRALSIKEIMDETDLSEAAVKKAIKELQAAYAERDTVLEVGKAGTKWAMQVRAEAAEPAARFAAMEIAPKLLKTLALIAYHQPLKQSELCDMIGSKVYDHVPELKELGLVKTRRDGQTKILTTTERFPEYFGLDAATPDQIRTAMAKLVGLDAPPKKAKKDKELQSFTEQAPMDSGAEAPNETGGPAVEAAQEDAQEETVRKEPMGAAQEAPARGAAGPVSSSSSRAVSPLEKGEGPVIPDTPPATQTDVDRTLADGVRVVEDDAPKRLHHVGDDGGSGTWSKPVQRHIL